MSLNNYPYSGKAILEVENFSDSINTSFINFPKNISLVGEDQYLFTVNSEDFKIRILMKIVVCYLCNT